MEQKITFVIGIVSTVGLGLVANFIYDKIKNHSSQPTKSGFELDIKIKFKK